MAEPAFDRARLKAIFAEASELPADDVEAYLAEACGADAALRAEVESLLAYRASDSDFLGSDSGSNGSGAASPPRFRPGDVLEERYRVVTRIGTGGMGDVYRAQDLRLDQDVALKFLPTGLEPGTGGRAALQNEVRMARRVSHPNVCRVHDLVRTGDELFLSMEYVDGEDLGALLRRIGRLPVETGLDIGRQICAGVAAAHGHGVLHRDLKPANVLIDARGKVRLTDFGLAAEVDTLAGRGGTPAYMAPEQLRGERATERSDLFALGALLYELFTGRAAYPVARASEREPDRDGPMGPEPSRFSADLPGPVEAVIAQCLRVDPSERPGSAAEVGVTLSGGDPIRAALAAGETPSPELLAAAPAEPSRRRWLWGGAALFLVFTLAGLFAQRAYYPIQRGALPRPPEVLFERARKVLGLLGDDDPRPYLAQAFSQEVHLPSDGGAVDVDWLLFDPKPREAGRVDLFYWCRESQGSLYPETLSVLVHGAGTAALFDPPLAYAGDRGVVLSPNGDLAWYRSVPDGEPTGVDIVGPDTIGPDAAGPPPAEPSWAPLFDACGLAFADFESVEPKLEMGLVADRRWAFTGAHPAEPGRPVRVEAATWRGELTFFAALEPAEAHAHHHVPFGRAGAWSYALLFTLTSLIALPLAWRNVGRGRSDRRGALRLAVVWFVCSMVHWALRATHADDPHTLFHQTTFALAWALFEAGQFWVLYTALEPLVRRYAPTVLYSWSRVLHGRLSDALVRRDLAVGAAVGAFWMLIECLEDQARAVVADEPTVSLVADSVLTSLSGSRHALGGLLVMPLWSVHWGVQRALEFALLLAVVKRPLVAAGALLLFHGSFDVLLDDLPLLGFGADALGHTLLEIALLLRFGLTAVCAAHFVNLVLTSYPISLDFGAWYAPSSTLGLAVPAALVLFALVARDPGPVGPGRPSTS